MTHLAYTHFCKCVTIGVRPNRRQDLTQLKLCPKEASSTVSRSKRLTNRSHEEVAQTLPGIPRNFLAIIKMNFHETNKQTRRGNSTYCVFFLPLAALYGAQVRGGDDGSSFIIHGKIALFIRGEERGVHSVRRSSMYTIPPPQPLIDERRVANAKVRV